MAISFDLPEVLGPDAVYAWDEKRGVWIELDRHIEVGENEMTITTKSQDVIDGAIEYHGTVECPMCQALVTFANPPEIDGGTRTFYSVCSGCQHALRVIATPLY